MRSEGGLLDLIRSVPGERAGFTVLFHRDLTRVGEVVTLHGGWTALGGDTHDGVRPCARVAGAAALVSARGGRLRIDGSAVAERLLSPTELASGVVLEVGDDAVLFIHRVRARQNTAPRFEMVGHSAAIEALREQITFASAVSVPVLLRGESGTGKDLAARAIAKHGPRAGRPFVAVNLAGIPPSIASSELFGHTPGAFTGAVGSHPGYFVQADGGTLFLDEIGAASLEVQAMLLRALETREIHPLGASRARPVDLRIIAATDENLEDAIRQGRFRAALYHRLAGYEIELPPLRARRDDIGCLLVHFLRQELEALGASERLDPSGLSPWLSAALVAELARSHWPGNVRELANSARRLAVAAARGVVCGDQRILRREPQTPHGGAMPDLPIPARRRPSSVGEEHLLSVLQASHWRMAEAARLLGISRTSLYALVDASDRVRKAKDIPEAELRESYEACGGRVDAMAEALEVSMRGLQLRLRDLAIRR